MEIDDVLSCSSSGDRSPRPVLGLNLVGSDFSLADEEGVRWYEIQPGYDLKSVKLLAGEANPNLTALVISCKSRYWKLENLDVDSCVPLVLVAPKRVHVMSVRSTSDLFILTATRRGEEVMEIEYGSCLLVGGNSKLPGCRLMVASNEVFLEGDIEAGCLCAIATHPTLLNLFVPLLDQNFRDIVARIGSAGSVADSAAAGSRGGVVSIAPDLQIAAKVLHVAATDPVNGGRISHRENLMKSTWEAPTPDLRCPELKVICHEVKLSCDGRVDDFKFGVEV